MSLWVPSAGPGAPAILTIDESPAHVDLVAYQGDDFRLLYRLSADPGDGTGAIVVPLTGCTGTMQVRVAESRTSALIMEPLFIADNMASGWIEHYATHAVMAAVNPGTYWYDAQVKSATGVVRTFLRGQFTVTAEISVES